MVIVILDGNMVNLRSAMEHLDVKSGFRLRASVDCLSAAPVKVI